ncbi:MAG: BON domain-containing protein [Planctomycetota bacterium]
MKSSIVHEAQHKLKSSSHHFARTVQCDYADGVLKIAGKVPSFYLKQTAQSLIQDIEGVDQIENDIVVVSPYGVSSEPSVMTH